MGLEDGVLLFGTNKLPKHPLEDEGFVSIGCRPCTRRWTDTLDDRAAAGLDSIKQNVACTPHLAPKKIQNKRVISRCMY